MTVCSGANCNELIDGLHGYCEWCDQFEGEKSDAGEVKELEKLQAWQIMDLFQRDRILAGHQFVEALDVMDMHDEIDKLRADLLAYKYELSMANHKIGELHKDLDAAMVSVEATETIWQDKIDIVKADLATCIEALEKIASKPISSRESMSLAQGCLAKLEVKK